MNIKQFMTAALAVTSLAILPALTTGCSQSSAPSTPDQSATGPAVSNPHPAQSPAAMQAAEDKIKSDPGLTPAQKEVMVEEAQHYGGQGQQSSTGQ